MNFISIGGWCGTKMALKDLEVFYQQAKKHFDERKFAFKCWH